MAHTITVQGTNPTQLTAEYQLQYELTMNASAGGTVQPSSGWHVPGAALQITAHPNTGYVLERWEGAGNGSYSGTTNPVTVTMDEPLTQTAWFTVRTDIPVTSAIPRTCELHQNYPNPFNPSTTIEYLIPGHGNVRLRGFDLLGREVAVLVDEIRQSGVYAVEFIGTKHPSGIYVYQLEWNGAVMTRRMTLLK
ncbi:MAG: T9SS type A sorting domain-containing protein [Bacteroidetes bacterium]|nr:T9SS type A sorting domain-containing protein [Bacteroidota bacterium]